MRRQASLNIFNNCKNKQKPKSGKHKNTQNSQKTMQMQKWRLYVTTPKISAGPRLTTIFHTLKCTFFLLQQFLLNKYLRLECLNLNVQSLCKF